MIWRKINKLLNRGSRQTEKLELLIGDKTIQGVELANSFNTYFTTLVPSLNTNGSKQFLGPPNSHSAFFDPTAPSGVYSVFMSLKNSTARDIDDLQIKPLKYVLDLLVPVLCNIFNLSLSTGAFPKNMQHASVTVLFKSGNKNEFGNYRPISVLPVMSKGLEKIICNRIVSFCEKHCIISPNQFGFRRGMSTELALLNQKEYILTGFENKKKNYFRHFYRFVESF